MATARNEALLALIEDSKTSKSSLSLALARVVNYIDGNPGGGELDHKLVAIRDGIEKTLS